MNVPRRPSHAFSVYRFFEDGSQDCICRFVTGDEAVKQVIRHTNSDSEAVRTGVLRRVTITDDYDMTVYQWEYGKPKGNLDEL